MRRTRRRRTDRSRRTPRPRATGLPASLPVLSQLKPGGSNSESENVLKPSLPPENKTFEKKKDTKHEVLESLKPGQWLTDDVIDFWYQRLTHQFPNMYFVPPAIARQIQWGEANDAKEPLAQIVGKLDKTGKVFFPLNNSKMRRREAERTGHCWYTTRQPVISIITIPPTA